MRTHPGREINWHALAEQCRYCVGDMAKAAGMSRRALERFFAAEFQTSPLAWVELYRHKQALELLGWSARSVKCIGTDLGYSELSAFSRAFKRREGVSPAAFRARLGTP